MPLINCKVELKYTWTKYCWQLVLIILIILILIILFNSNIIIFNIKDTKLHIPVVTLSARDNKKLSKLLSKRFERSDRNKYKTKSENKNTTNEYTFSNQILLELIDCLFYFIQIMMTMLKDLMLKNIIYQKA